MDGTMQLLKILMFVTSINFTVGQLTQCEQKSPKIKVDAFPQNPDKYFELSIESNTQGFNQENKQYLPDQTYLVRLKSNNSFHPFKWFMITAEDPDPDSVNDREPVDVGSLKLLSNQSRYSERCSNSIEDTDNSDKNKIEVHWLSPKQSNRKSVRLRAMVAENDEVWYEGGNLILDIERNVQKPPDAPPIDVVEECNLCSEARYENPSIGVNSLQPALDQLGDLRSNALQSQYDWRRPVLCSGPKRVVQITFQGKWSRLTHSRHYPTKPYETGYSTMIGASHDNNFELWKPETEAKNGLQLLAERGNISEIQDYIIQNIHPDEGVRTLIKGRGHFHPQMFDPSYALFRVDRIHHLFSILVGLRPSPDWFLGAFAFELCTENGWLKEYEMPLYPWDAGTANGVAYESETSVTQPRDHVGRVDIGSLDPDSPFYGVNLNDLRPFATIHVRRLDVYQITDGSCNTGEKEEGEANEKSDAGAEEAVRDSAYEEPVMLESKQKRNCQLSDWGDWSACEPQNGSCGTGTQSRFRYNDDTNIHIRYYAGNDYSRPESSDCNDMTTQFTQIRECFVECK